MRQWHYRSSRESTALNDQIYVFGKRRWVKPNRKWRTLTSRVCNGEKQPKPDTADDAQAQKINRIFMFGSAAREMTKNKSSLPALQELSSPQDLAENQLKIKRKPSCWFRFDKFKVGPKKTTSTSHVGGTTKKRRGNTTASRRTTPYVMRDLELKLEERMRDKKKI